MGAQRQIKQDIVWCGHHVQVKVSDWVPMVSEREDYYGQKLFFPNPKSYPHKSCRKLQNTTHIHET